MQAEQVQEWNDAWACGWDDAYAGVAPRYSSTAYLAGHADGARERRYKESGGSLDHEMVVAIPRRT